MKNVLTKIVFVALTAAPLSSWALFEARLTYGSLASQQSLTDLCQGSCAAPSNAPAIIPTFGLGADAIVELPFFPLGVGLRMEDMKLSASTSSIDAELKYTRTALILNYRLIDTIVHFGPIATFGISHTGSMSIKENGTSRVDLSPGSLSSYSVGVELGIKPLVVLPLKVGAEAGYMSFNWGKVTNTIDSSQKDIDLSGVYLKVFLGLDI
ncbi:MAG: hypothetical protein ABL930_11370 [Pseudobdellovibrio sp.]